MFKNKNEELHEKIKVNFQKIELRYEELKFKHLDLLKAYETLHTRQSDILKRLIRLEQLEAHRNENQ